MGIAERSGGEMVSATRAEGCVVLRLEFPHGCSRAQLEDFAIAVQEALDERASDVAPGAAVGADFERPSIEVVFGVSASSTAETYQRVALVLAAIEPALPFTASTELETHSVRPDQELAPA